MPKHSLVVLIGFAKSATAAATHYTDEILAAQSNPRRPIAEIEALAEKVVAQDRAVKALQTQTKDKIAELRRLKRELYNQTSSLVDLGAGSCGKQTSQGKEFIALRKKLRRRRSPQRPAANNSTAPRPDTPDSPA